MNLTGIHHKKTTARIENDEELFSLKKINMSSNTDMQAHAKKIFSEGCHSYKFYKLASYRRIEDRYNLALINCQRILFGMVSALNDYQESRSSLNFFESMFFSSELTEAKIKYVVKPLKDSILSLRLHHITPQKFNTAVDEIIIAFNLNESLSATLGGQSGKLGKILFKTLQKFSKHNDLFELYHTIMKGIAPVKIEL